MLAAPYLRGQVAKALRLRAAPELTSRRSRIGLRDEDRQLMHRPEIARTWQED